LKPEATSETHQKPILNYKKQQTQLKIIALLKLNSSRGFGWAGWSGNASRRWTKILAMVANADKGCVTKDPRLKIIK
jgi:hypothetical protein